MAATLIAASAAIVFLLGATHFVYTFAGTKLHPRDASLVARMTEVPPVITTQTNMWRAWIGFNASHSLGAIIFGATYIFLATRHPQMLMQSGFLLAQGLVVLMAYLWLGARYWFRVPFRSVAISTALYLAALVAVWVG